MTYLRRILAQVPDDARALAILRAIEAEPATGR
jgi:hypothetical protein